MNPNPEVYFQSLAKCERAKKHIDDLDSCLTAFREANVDIIARKHDVQTGEVVYYVDHVPPLSRDFAILIGDALHNLRCALDYLFSGMVDRSGGTVGPNTKLPISHSPEAYVSATRVKVTTLSQQALNALDRIKPYKRGNDNLWTLHKLNNIDKHRLLLAANVVMAGRSLTPSEVKGLPPQSAAHIEKFGARKYVISNTPIGPAPLEAGQILVTIPAAEANQQMGFLIEVTPNEPSLTERSPFSLLLRRLHAEVSQVVSELAYLV